MSDNQVLVDALVKFQRWCDAGGPDLYDHLASRESELAEAQRRVAELEEALKLWMTYDGMGNPDPLSILLMARNATATLLRITRIPGKEDDDGEMH